MYGNKTLLIWIYEKGKWVSSVPLIQKFIYNSFKADIFTYRNELIYVYLGKLC